MVAYLFKRNNNSPLDYQEKEVIKDDIDKFERKSQQTFSFEKFLDCPASWLSAGEKRRLSLLRLSFCPAKVWILDETSTYLDKDNKEILISIINGHINSGGAIICATHENFNIPNVKEYSLS